MQHLDQNFSYFDQLLLLGFEISTSIIIGDDVLKFRNMERNQKWMLPDLIFVIFSPQMYFLGSIFLHINCSRISQSFVIFVTNMSSGYFSLFSLSNCFVLFTLISFYFFFLLHAQCGLNVMSPVISICSNSFPTISNCEISWPAPYQSAPPHIETRSQTTN